jgi:hypothetical protein
LILQLIIDLVKDLHFLEAAVTVDIHFEHADLGTNRGKKNVVETDWEKTYRRKRNEISPLRQPRVAATPFALAL